MAGRGAAAPAARREARRQEEEYGEKQGPAERGRRRKRQRREHTDAEAARARGATLWTEQHEASGLPRHRENPRANSGGLEMACGCHDNGHPNSPVIELDMYFKCKKSVLNMFQTGSLHV
ncbi:unnamed protein product [Prorocentrum cordatum]|uniref:Uncharacterized protein n=1 Tax=Prorocentrum cordatum TaxID=2364126 RepID=A0ABN9PMP1_9DINO|nr:unnamed protein product [Polarella glacialis]